MNPETRTFKETIELEHIVKYTFIPKNPESSKIEALKMVHSTRTLSSDLARQLLGEMNEEESHCAKYYRSNLQLACKYIEDKAAISS